MKAKLFTTTAIILLSVMLFTACQAQPYSVDTAFAAAAPSATVHSAPARIAAAAPTAQPTPTLEPTAVQPPEEDPADAQSAQAEEAARAYFTAVSEGHSEDAAEQLSAFSLMVFQMTRGDAASLLLEQKSQGIRWSDLEVLGTQPFTTETVLVHVRYQVTGAPAADGTPTATPTPAPTAAKSADKSAAKPEAEVREELWPFRLEFGEWRYNWDNLIDFRTLDTPAQTTSGITVMPVQMSRYSDRLQLTLLVQNRTNEAAVFGQVNETLGTFHFGEETVIAEKTRWILNPLRSVPNAALEAAGLFEEYPDSIEIRKWTNYNVKPWYEFELR